MWLSRFKIYVWLFSICLIPLFPPLHAFSWVIFMTLFYSFVGCQNHSMVRRQSFNKWWWKTWISTCKKQSWTLSLHCFTPLSAFWISLLCYFRGCCRVFIYIPSIKNLWLPYCLPLSSRLRPGKQMLWYIHFSHPRFCVIIVLYFISAYVVNPTIHFFSLLFKTVDNLLVTFD